MHEKASGIDSVLDPSASPVEIVVYRTAVPPVSSSPGAPST
jgi:hypothetical protein